MRGRPRSLSMVGIFVLTLVLVPALSDAHPMGNFSISHYAGLRIDRQWVEVRYLIDMAEIPTFQEIQEWGVVAEAHHPSVPPYLARRTEEFRGGLHLELNGRPLRLQAESRQILFVPGAGNLPTVKIGAVYRARLEGIAAPTLNRLSYRDENFGSRIGWKEVVATAGPGVIVATSSVPERDRSRELSDYPTDLLDSPPQQLEAQVVFVLDGSRIFATASPSPGVPPSAPGAGEGPEPPGMTPPPVSEAPASAPAPSFTFGSAALTAARLDGRSTVEPRGPEVLPLEPSDPASPATKPLVLGPNRQSTPRGALTDLVTASDLRPSLLLLAALVAAALGAFHALEPGHGKTVVAAYLVGSRGTAWHAVLLGLVVTISHTAGVYLLGAVTLYASRYVLPERLYPWLGVISGLTIAGLGIALFLRRYASRDHPADGHDAHGHAHDGHSRAGHTHDGASAFDHAHDRHGHGSTHHSHAHHHHRSGDAVSLSELFALGVTGGIVPCPAALVVLLSALSLGRVGFGLVLIVAFSLGLAAVLIIIGVLMVYARRLVAGVRGDGAMITRWLPLTSSAVITLLGLAVAVQALHTAGIVQVRIS